MTGQDEGGAMGTGRSYHDVYESGRRIPADEIAEWKADAAEYIPRLFHADPVQFAPMARFLRAALLIVGQFQSDAAQGRAAAVAPDIAAQARRDCTDELRALAVPGPELNEDDCNLIRWAADKLMTGG